MKIITKIVSIRFPGLLIAITLLTVLLGLSVPFPAAAGTAVPPHPNLESLQAQAAAQGQVRVIIGLNIPFTPEGDLDKQAGPQAVQVQQQAIRAAQNRVWQQIAGYNSQRIATFKYIPAMTVVVDTAALGKLASLPDVAYIEEDRLSLPTLASSIPVIGADTAWAAGFTGAGQTVAILDTGVDKTHPFLDDGKVVSEACYSTTGFSSTYGYYESVCPGGVQASTAVGSGGDCVAATEGYPLAQLDCEHGTHVAGIAAGDGGGGTNIGVAPDSNVIAIQVFTFFIDFERMASFSTDQISGLERVYELRDEYNIAAVNMSLGAGQYLTACDSDPRKAIIDTLRSVGIATVIASGNDGYTISMGAPACISSAVSVGATEDDDDVAVFSNVASFLDLFAPGVGITSSIPGGGTSTEDGTSMATPHVVGAWAVLRSYAGLASVDDILAALKDTGTLVDDNRTDGTVTGIPRINVDLAMNNLTEAAKGTIIVEKQTLPDGSPTAFTFSGSAAGSISDGQQIVVADLPAGTYFSTETVPDGWELTGIVCDDANSSGDLAANKATFHLEAGETVTCTFTNTQIHTLSTNENGSGTITAVPDQTTFLHGEIVSLSAAATPGWTFANWSGSISSNTNPVIVTMDSDKSITANFTQDEYTLTITIDGDGVVNPVPDQATYHYGDVVELTAVANPGWAFSDWSGDLVSSENPASVTITGSTAITATFMAGEFTLTLHESGQGTATAVPDKVIYNPGDEVVVTAAADPGWTFFDWSGDVISTSNPITLTIVADQVITATFTQDEYTLSLDAGQGGAITAVPDKDVYNYGDEVELTAVADPGWTFADWSGDVSSTSNPVMLTITGDHTVTAAFTQDEYTLSLDAGQGGTITAVPDQAAYHYGDEVTLTATADPGWTFSNWSGAVGGTGNPVMLTITGDHTVTAVFTQDEYTLDINLVGSGTVTAVPEKTTYIYGDEVALTAVADPGWTFAGWSDDAVGSNNPITLTITGSQTISATFTQDEYTLTLNTEGDGTITAVPEKATYHYGDVVTLTAVTGPNSAFVKWNGDVISSSNPIILTITGDQTVTATFKPEFKIYLPLTVK